MPVVLGTSEGIVGMADVMYAAGFPFPNMIGAAAIGMGAMSITKDAAEYENIMTTVRSILKATDNAITTFNQRFSDMSRNIRKVGCRYQVYHHGSSWGGQIPWYGGFEY